MIILGNGSMTWAATTSSQAYSNFRTVRFSIANALNFAALTPTDLHGASVQVYSGYHTSSFTGCSSRNVSAPQLSQSCQALYSPPADAGAVGCGTLEQEVLVGDVMFLQPERDYLFVTCADGAYCN